VVEQLEGQFTPDDEIFGPGIFSGTRIASQVPRTELSTDFQNQFRLSLRSESDTPVRKYGFSENACRRAAIISKNNHKKALEWLIKEKDNPNINMHLYDASETVEKNPFDSLDNFLGTYFNI